MQTSTAMKELTNLQKTELNFPIASPLNPTKKLTSPPTIYIRTTGHLWITPPYKGPICHLQKYLITYDCAYTLELVAQTFPNINKWTSEKNIDIATSIYFWKHPLITDAQKTCILKFRYNQYMGNARKQLFFGVDLYPTLSYSICNLS
jgi:hypothetical protein